MSERFVILESSVRADLQVVGRLYEDLGTPDLAESEPEEKLIVAAYRLHSLYTALENIFRNVAVAFENELRERVGWHGALRSRPGWCRGCLRKRELVGRRTRPRKPPSPRGNRGE